MLHRLSFDDILAVSEKYLMGWTDLMAAGYGFRVQGLNAMRKKHGLCPLTADMMFRHRTDYIRAHFTEQEIYDGISAYIRDARVDKDRWKGIELFDCRFGGKEYAKAFRELLGSSVYRKLSEEYRVRKLMETQDVLYGGTGLAGALTLAKAQATNQERYGGLNVMANSEVRARVAATNLERYGGITPFADKTVRMKGYKIKDPELWEAIFRYKRTHQVPDLALDSKWEFQVFRLLASRFGTSDVFCQYGIHPSDKRYPHNCDFYIKSLDLFIELNLHFCHGGHWFDVSNPQDVERLEMLRTKGHPGHYKAMLTYWAGKDVVKRQKAAASGINFLVFWGDRRCISGAIPDFEAWFYDYDCDFRAFLKDHPENGY